MRLKSVRIYGFKTFADRTEFDVRGGIVAVVGPNGCGKSNLVDAILWGLGEGNARQLRAQNSQDVIFSGSSRRKAVGYAEVTLLFDNEDGALPIDSAEVSITRKLNRAGESEYRINRSQCRLKDVLDLLADTGLGRAGYAIVGQKEIDQALAASPEDRRAWVDEAAGVQRYRARKVESNRRLAQAQVHLERVADILLEIDNQREPLKEEAEVAIRYKELLSSLRAVESGLLMVDIFKSVKELKELESRSSEAQRIAAKENALAEAAEHESHVGVESLRSLDRRLEVARSKLQEASLAFERAEGSIKLGEQKLKALIDLEQNLGDDTSNARSEDLAKEVETLRVELAVEESKLKELAEANLGAGEAANRLTAELDRVEKQLHDARASQAERLKREAEVAHAQERTKNVRREIKGIDATLPSLEQGLADAQAALQEHLDVISGIEQEAATLADKLTALQQEDRRDEEIKVKWLSEHGSLEGRRQGLEMTIAAHEGLTHGSRAVMEAARNGMLPDVYVPVGEAVDVDTEYALAIEVALGNAANDLICPHGDDAKAAIRLLKEHQLGRATFQPLPLMRPVAADLRDVLGKVGVIGRASDLVQCVAAHRPVVDSLLGRVVVVETLDDALAYSRTHGWSRLVTLDGELVHQAGAVTGGQSARQSYGLVQRKSELADLERTIGTLDAKIREAQKRIEKRREARQADEAALAQLVVRRKEADEESREAREWLAQLRDEHSSTLRSKTKLEAELASLGQLDLVAVSVEDLPKLEASRDALLKQCAAKTADAEVAEARLREADARLEQARLRLEMGVRRHEASIQHESLRVKKLTNLGPERIRAEIEVESAQKERERATDRKADAETELAGLIEEREKLTFGQEARLEEGRRARHAATEQLQTAHQAELGRARIDARRAASAQRLMEEYGLTEDDALAQAPGIEVPSDAATLVSRLRREMRAMGDVNLGAVEAYERLTERSQELTNQKADVELGIEEIRASIRELDRLTRDRFVTTFEQVRDAFAELFGKLFEGGEGAISLNDPENTLDSGIEIDVTLPGKKRQRLELLSGGERSLCAAAFLFALLKVKPSPLVVLDEVDAPLDGRNVERFVQLLAEFSQITQFIVITHNPVTIESAPVWLGVTMQEPGVSTLVPARAPQQALALAQ